MLSRNLTIRRWERKLIKINWPDGSTIEELHLLAKYLSFLTSSMAPKANIFLTWKRALDTPSKFFPAGGWVQPLRLKVPLRSIKALVLPPPLPPSTKVRSLKGTLEVLRYPLSSTYPLRYPLTYLLIPLKVPLEGTLQGPPWRCP